MEKAQTNQKASNKQWEEKYNNLQQQFLALEKKNSELNETTEKQETEILELKTNAYLPLEKMIAAPNPCGTIVYAFNENILSSGNGLQPENELNIDAMYMLNVINGSKHFDAKNIFITSFNPDSKNSVLHRIAIHKAIKLNTTIPCEYDETTSCIDDSFRKRVEKLCQLDMQNNTNRNESKTPEAQKFIKQKNDIELGKISLLEIIYTTAKQRKKNKIQGNIQVMFFNDDELVTSELIIFFNAHRKTLLAKGVDLCFWKSGKFSAVVQGEDYLIRRIDGIKDYLIGSEPTTENSVIDWDTFINRYTINNKDKSCNEKTTQSLIETITKIPSKVKNILDKGLSMFHSTANEDNNSTDKTKTQSDIEASKLGLIIKKEDGFISDIKQGFKKLSEKEQLTYNPKF